MLTKEEEAELIRAYQNGDSEAGTAIIEHNKKFVTKIAWGFLKKNTGFTLDELVHEGSIGLLKALNTFDLSLNYTLLTYAELGIYHRILRYVTNDFKHKELSLDTPVNDDGDDGYTLLDTIADTSESADITINRTENNSYIKKLLDNLTDKEKVIVKLVFWEDLNLIEIGEQLRLSRGRVEQILAKAIRKLRYHGSKNKILALHNNILKCGDRYIEIKDDGGVIKNRSY